MKQAPVSRFQEYEVVFRVLVDMQGIDAISALEHALLWRVTNKIENEGTDAIADYTEEWNGRGN